MLDALVITTLDFSFAVAIPLILVLVLVVMTTCGADDNNGESITVASDFVVGVVDNGFPCCLLLLILTIGVVALLDNLDMIFWRSLPAITTTGDPLEGIVVVIVVVGFGEAAAAAFFASKVARRNVGDTVGNLTRGGVGSATDCVELLDAVGEVVPTAVREEDVFVNAVVVDVVCEVDDVDDWISFWLEGDGDLTTVIFDAFIDDVMDEAAVAVTIVICFNVFFVAVAIVDDEDAILFLLVLVVVVVIGTAANVDEAILTTLYFPRS